MSAKKETNFDKKDSLRKQVIDYMFGTEIWALVLVMFTQDLPFFIIRLLVLINYPNLQSNYTAYFFVVKNFILIIFTIYYVTSIVIEIKKKAEEPNDLDDEAKN